MPDTNPVFVKTQADLFQLLREIKDKLDIMGDAGHGLMYKEKNDVVGWWRALPKTLLWIPSKTWAYAFFLLLACFPFQGSTTPPLEDLLDYMEKEEPKACDDFCEQFPVVLFLIFGSVLDTPVGSTCVSLHSFCFDLQTLTSFPFTDGTSQRRVREISN